MHFQWPIMYSLSGINPELISRVWVDEMYVVYGTWLSTIGIIFWLLGFSTFNTVNQSNSTELSFKYSKLLYFTIFTFIIFLLTAGNDFLSGGVYKGSGGTASGGGISVYFGLLFSICIILLTTIVVLDNRKFYSGNIFRWFFNLDYLYLIVFFSYLTIFLFIGDRGGPVSLILSLFVLIGYFIRPIKLRELTFFIVFGSLFLTLISLGRGESSGFGIIQSGFDNFNLSSGYDTTLELANSVRTLFKSLTEVPQNHDYFYGLLWVSDILAPIPFAQSAFLKFTNIPSHELGSAGYITYITFGSGATSGEGSSLIADIYLNFSLGGVCFFMFLLGLFFKKVNNNLILNNSIKWIIIGIFIASFSLYFSRSGLFVTFRPMIWGILFYYLLVTKFKIL